MFRPLLVNLGLLEDIKDGSPPPAGDLLKLHDSRPVLHGDEVGTRHLGPPRRAPVAQDAEQRVVLCRLADVETFPRRVPQPVDAGSVRLHVQLYRPLLWAMGLLLVQPPPNITFPELQRPPGVASLETPDASAVVKGAHRDMQDFRSLAGGQQAVAPAQGMCFWFCHSLVTVSENSGLSSGHTAELRVISVNLRREGHGC